MTTTLPWVDDWLSSDRFASYVIKAGGDRDRALALYEWNSQLSAAFLHDLCHFEVALRNAYDPLLNQAVQPGDRHWTDPATTKYLFPPHYRPISAGKVVDVNSKPRDSIAFARRSAGGRNAKPGKVVAELMFGFWTYLTSDTHDKTLWVPLLHRAYPAHTDRNLTNATLAELRNFRNRVAHHEPIFDRPEAKRRQLAHVMKLVRPQAYPHFIANSHVAAIIATRP